MSGSSAQRAKRQQVEIALASFKGVFGLGERLATSLVGLATRIAAKIAVYTPMPSWSTAAWGERKGGSKSCGHEPDNTHLDIPHTLG